MPDIAHIDRNLVISRRMNLPKTEFVEARLTEWAELYGFSDTEQDGFYRRVPQEIADETSEGVALLCKNTAGGRIRFRTDSDYVAIRAEMPDKCLFTHMAFEGSSGFDLYVGEDGRETYMGSLLPPVERTDGYESVVRFEDRREREITIDFPLYDNVRSLYIGLCAGAKAVKGKRYRDIKPVVYYGSSITQGGCASRPGNCYQAMICRDTDVDYRNLGFSGNAKGELAIREYIASLDMSLFFLDYDHNAPNPEHLAQTHRKVYDAVRNAHPDIPIIIASKTDIPLSAAAREETLRRRQIIMDTVEYAVAAGDKNVTFIDGQTVFAPYGDSCTVDGCHPNDLGFYAMAKAYGAEIKRALKL